MYNSSFSLILYKFFAAFTIVALALMALPVAPTYAAALTVTSNADTIAVDGQCTLREAIINANVDGGAGTTVDCATGAGADVITFNAGMTITLSSALPDIADVDGLTINGSSAVIVDGGGAFRIFQITSGTATFQNITIQNGQITGNGGGVYNNGGSGLTISNVTFKANRTVVAPGNDGGAIYHSSGTLDISNSTFTNNYTQDNGGAIYIAGGTGTMTITNSTFTNQNNAAIDAGAAVYLNAGTLIIDNTTFTSNIASLNGGAIHNVNGLLTVTISTFSTNSAENGGAIYHNSPSLLTVSNSSFIGNTTTVAGGDGGAIKLDDNFSSTTISGSTFTSNTAEDEGGAIFNDGEPFTVITSTFTSNVAGAGSTSPAFGGAIYNSANSGSAASKISLSSFINNSITMNANRNAQGGAIANIGTIIIANNTFSGNSLTKSTAGVGDSLGGAVYAGGVTTIHNATFSGNTVSENGVGIGSGGAIYSAVGAITIANSIVTDGTENGAAGNCGGTFTDGGNNVEFNGGADCGFGITTNPNLGALTGSPQYFPLTSSSSAIDMGSNAICATATSTNNESQNGVTRPVDGDAVAGAICDIGSFEALSVQIALVTNSPVTYNGLPQAATVTCSGGGAVSDIKYDGSSTIPTNAATYAVTADCAANGSYGSGNDLPAGNFVINTAAQTASVTNSPVTYNGSPQAALVTCSGGGAVSDIQYDGSSTIPTNAATYTVTADCAATTNYSSGNDLPAGNFVINTAAQAASVTNSPVTYNGSPQAAIVTCSGGGAVSDIKYDGSSTIPTNAATYAVTADCAANGSYGSGNDLPAGNFVINTAAQTASVTNSPVTYNGSPQAALVTCSGGGAVSDIQYDGSSTIPTNIATYTVTADCAATTNYSSGNDLPAGNFVIDAGIQTASVTNSPVTYNGSPQAAIVTCSGGGAVSDIKYDGSSTIPTNAATYAITADCAANGSYGSENDLPAGNFVIDTATLTVTATSETINYGDTPVFAFTYGAFAGTDDSGDLTTEPTCDAGGGPYTAAGSPYTITCSGGVDDNYDFSYTDGTLTVNAINNVSVTINQSGGQVDPTNSSPISFTVIFGVAVTGFTDGDPGDVSLSGTAGATTFSITEIAPNDGTTYHVDVSGMAGSGTVIADIPAGVVVDVDGNGNMASTSKDHTVIYDTVYPVVLFNTDTIPANASVLTVGPSQIKVAFSKDITISSAEDTANYILIEDGVNNIFDTTAADPCLSGIQTDDTTIAVNSASYDNGSGIGPYVATLVINGGVGLPVGNYSLFICGTTSIADPSGNELNDGVRDTALNFSVVPAVNRLPATGFPQGVVTTLSAQPAAQTYAAYSDLWLEIPKLSVKTSIVGVPSTGDSWNVSWLGSNSGWLNGSAFPTWSGNSVITAHVWDALNRPGVFANLKNLKYGDQVIVHAFGQAYTYEIRENSLILSTSYSTVFKHEDKSWITLVTCEGYTSTTGEYTNRRMVRAVLVSVASE